MAEMGELEALSLDAFSFSSLDEGEEKTTGTAADAVSAAAADIEERRWSKRRKMGSRLDKYYSRTDKEKRKEDEEDKDEDEEGKKEKRTVSSKNLAWRDYDLDLDFSISANSGVDKFWGERSDGVEATVAAAVARAEASRKVC